MFLETTRLKSKAIKKSFQVSGHAFDQVSNRASVEYIQHHAEGSKMLMATSGHRVASEHWGTASKERSRRWCSGGRPIQRRTAATARSSGASDRRNSRTTARLGSRVAAGRRSRIAAGDATVSTAAPRRKMRFPGRRWGGVRRGEEADGGAGGSPRPWGSAGRRTRWRRSVQCGGLNTSAAWRASLVVQADEGAVGGAWVAGRCSDPRQPGGFSAGAGSHGGKAGRRDARKGGGGRGEGGEIWWRVWHGERRR